VLFLDMTSLLLLLPPDELEAVTCRESFCEVGARALATSDVRVVLGVTSAARPGSQPASGLAQSAALGVLPVWPLRERRDDIEPLVRHFVGETCRLARREPNEISAEALAVLRRYDWPGNVDELRRVVDHMIRCSRPACLDSSLIPQHVAIGPSAGRRSPSDLEKGLGGRVRDFEQALICDALARCQGNLSAAARLLGVSVSTLHSKQKQYGAVARATEG
jgi:DNA-binding NtrC family response regulator